MDRLRPVLMFDDFMNFSMTFTDNVGLESANEEVQASAAVTKSIYEAVKYDPEFRQMSFCMFEEKQYEELRGILSVMLANETARLLSDTVAAAELNAASLEPGGRGALAKRISSLISVRSNASLIERLASSFDMIDDGKINLVACYREAYSRFDMEMDFYRELTRKDKR